MKETIPNNAKVGERIRETRESLKMNRETFSEMINISDVFLGQIERGERSLSIKTLCKIVQYTGFSTDYILFGDSSNNSMIEKINKILNTSSDEMISYFYKIINYSKIFFKNSKIDI